MQIDDPRFKSCDYFNDDDKVVLRLEGVDLRLRFKDFEHMTNMLATAAMTIREHRLSEGRPLELQALLLEEIAASPATNGEAVVLAGRLAEQGYSVVYSVTPKQALDFAPELERAAQKALSNRGRGQH